MAFAVLVAGTRRVAADGLAWCHRELVPLLPLEMGVPPGSGIRGFNDIIVKVTYGDGLSNGYPITYLIFTVLYLSVF